MEQNNVTVYELDHVEPHQAPHCQIMRGLHSSQILCSVVW